MCYNLNVWHTNMLCITIIWVTAGTCKPTVSQSKQFTTYLWEKQFKFIHLVFRHCQLLPLHHKLQLHQDPTVQKYTTSSCHTNTSLPSYPALTLCLQRRGSVFVNENAKRITDRRRIKEALFFFCFLKLHELFVILTLALPRLPTDIRSSSSESCVRGRESEMDG